MVSTREERRTKNNTGSRVGIIILGLLLVPVLVGDPQENSSIYLIMILSCAGFVLLFFKKQRICKSQALILVTFLVLAFIQLLGCFAADSMSAIRYPIYTISIGIFVVVSVSILDEVNPLAMLVVCFCCMGILLYRVILARDSEDLGNSLAGMAVFICVVLIFSGIKYSNYIKSAKPERHSSSRDWKKKIIVVAMIIALLFFLVVIYESHARSALFVLLIIFSAFIILTLWRPKRRTLISLFWFCVVLGILGIAAYINVREFDWYSYLNYYSVEFFGKNIDTSRPLLWSMSIGALRDNWLIGLGTGFLPSFGHFTEVSFHNSYLQILVPNGVLALICLICIFFFIWRELASCADDALVRLILAAFIGILIYNCFEATLLSNKLSIGFLEWFVLSMGVARSLKLKTGYVSENTIVTTKENKWQ